VLALTPAAQILVVLDITVVNTALTTSGRSLRLGSADLQCSPWRDRSSRLDVSANAASRVADVTPLPRQAPPFKSSHRQC